MKIITNNYNIKPTKQTCPSCSSVLLYDQTDIKQYVGGWLRKGYRKPERKIKQYIVYPLYKKEIIINEWLEEF